MTCPFSFLSCFVLLSLCVCLCQPVRLTDANTPKKCRALFGLDQLSLWCKPCRYNCCRTTGRKTSAKSTFFSLIITHYASVPLAWQQMANSFCSIFHTEELPAINSFSAIFLVHTWSKASGRKWISKRHDQIFDPKGNEVERSRCHLERSF